MLTAHKKSIIKRNKKILAFVNERVKEGDTLLEAIAKASKKRSFGVKYPVASKIIHQRYYPWSPFFEYDDDGNKLYERDWDGNMVPGTETDAYWVKEAKESLQKNKVS